MLKSLFKKKLRCEIKKKPYVMKGLDVLHMSNKLGVKYDDVLKAIRHVGNDREKVERFLLDK